MTARDNLISQAVNHTFWTLILQGSAFVVLGLLIVVYPAILVALAAIAFLVVGLSLLLLAAKLRSIYRQLPGFLR
ncbi:MAG TPA: hypothetical protein VLI05_03975 [Candidatus Saccharimonadia bacterium]|nr:hypothetical protein [Candidatus Saccharimonadia bacterium]